jgi:hypothetical protein
MKIYNLFMSFEKYDIQAIEIVLKEREREREREREWQKF